MQQNQGLTIVFFSLHSSSLSKPGYYCTHNAALFLCIMLITVNVATTGANVTSPDFCFYFQVIIFNFSS